jgi:sugar phosphate isomerase/epimerase
VLAVTFAAGCLAADIRWIRISSKTGELPDPVGSNQQTGLLVANLDNSKTTGFVISHRVKGPALVWFRRMGNTWSRYVIERDFLTLEAGGAARDIDGDGDLDVVFGADGQNRQLWWWENPRPNFDPQVSWKRHIIKDSGANQHHDQVFADFLGIGKPQLVFWNQRAKTLFLTRLPSDPRNPGSWNLEPVFSGQAGEGIAGAALYAEGVDAFDVDADGRVDLLAGNYWFKLRDGSFQPIKVGPIGGRIRAGKFKPGKLPQIVIAPGDGSGPLMFFAAAGDPSRPESWTGRDLLGRDMIHGHTLDLGDVNGDGHLDIFAAEMAKWTRGEQPDHLNAAAWVLFGDGKGNFHKTTLVVGDGWHEGKLADVDSDGDLDVINKPYTWDAPRVDIWLNNGTGRRGTASWGAKGKSSPLRHQVGMELFTYRRELAKDLPGTLRMIREMGFRDIETANFYGRTAQEFRKILDETGLSCSSIITGYDRLKNNLDSVIADAKAVGAGYVLTAGIPRKGNLTLDDVRRTAADFNEWGEKLRLAGIRFGYHPHGFEFVPHKEGNLFDVLLAETRPDRVTYEMDVFWFLHGGADPVKYLERYPDRFQLVHLKDMAKGTQTGVLTGKAPYETSVALGTGMLDWPAIFRAADRAGIQRYYIEDESPDPLGQVPLTMKYLEKSGF